MQVADVRGFYRSVRGSVGAAAILLAWDVAFTGSCLMSSLLCPIWFLVSLIRNAIQRPGWRLALVRIGIPALTLWLARVNNDFQLAVANKNAQRVVTACEKYHAVNGKFPRTLDELVPQYMNSVPVAKYCFAWDRFFYSSHSSDSTMLVWHVVPPHLRKIYDFETRRWSYLD